MLDKRLWYLAILLTGWVMPALAAPAWVGVTTGAVWCATQDSQQTFIPKVQQTRPAREADQCLIRAIMEEDVALIDRCIAREADINFRGNGGWTPLMVAATRGNVTILEHLLGLGANVEDVSDEGWSSLMLAVYQGHEQAVLFLLQQGADLTRAAYVKSDFVVGKRTNTGIDFLERLVAEYRALGDNAQFKNFFHLNTLMIAVLRNQRDILDILVQEGADINSLNAGGISPLFWAIVTGDRQMVAQMLAFRANVNLRSPLGKTPLMFAAGFGFEDICLLLINAGAETNAIDRTGNSSLTYAVRLGRKKCVSLLLQQPHVKLNPKPYQTHTPLLMAIQAGDTDVVRMLVKRGADINHPNKQGETPVCAAVRQDRPEVLALLLRYKPDLSAAYPRSGNTALHLAVIQNHEAMVRRLIAADAPLHLRNNDGHTVLDLARENGHTNLVKILLKSETN
nr:ankyrin repeat domain-containing protein [Acanthopleuribacter pedis]